MNMKKNIYIYSSFFFRHIERERERLQLQKNEMYMGCESKYICFQVALSLLKPGAIDGKYLVCGG